MPNSIQLGLTFNGGVSLVVFQAGVAYELIRAVQFSRACNGHALAAALDADRIRLPDGISLPRLSVDVVTGTSSGGMAAIQLCLALGGINAEAVLERILHTWIDGADLKWLIPNRNCAEQGLLTHTKSETLMKAMLDAANSDPGIPGLPATDRDPLKLEQDLDCYLTLTNFHGLREPILLRERGNGARGTHRERTLPTTRHLEYELIDDDAIGYAADNKEERERIVSAVLATAGFPGAFEPVVRPSSAIDDGVATGEPRTTFAYIDGGVVDNQPLTVALDALAERPALDRRLFYIDPRVQWLPPGYGEANPDPEGLDPVSILRRLGDISRTDSVHQDLERVRAMEDQHELIAALRQRRDVQPALLAIYPKVRERRLHPGAWQLWTLIGGDEPGDPTGLVDAEVRTAWEDATRWDRLPLRARLAEYLREQLRDSKRPADHPAWFQLADDQAWSDFYRALANLRKLDRRFRQLRYQVWREYLCCRDEPGVLDRLRAAIVAAFRDLAGQGRRLHQVGQARLERLAGAVGAQDLDTWCKARLDEARAVQVLESLAGTSTAGALRVRRVTPFDIYVEGADRNRLHPLAGGQLNSFGGFLNAGWRANDFLVGRLAMRRRLVDEGLIPALAMDPFIAWSRHRDSQVIARLPANFPARDLLIRFQDDAIGPPPYPDDDHKPGLLLRPDAMDLGELPARDLLGRMPTLAGSLVRISRNNRTRPPYPLLGLAAALTTPVTGLLAIAASWPAAAPLTTTELFARLRRLGWWLLAALLMGIAIGRHSQGG